jgi:hypothetical protein
MNLKALICYLRGRQNIAIITTDTLPAARKEPIKIKIAPLEDA